MPEILDDQANLLELLEHIPVPAGLISLESGTYVAVNPALQQISAHAYLLPQVLNQQMIQQLQQGEIIRDYQLEILNYDHKICTLSLTAKLLSWRGDHLIFCVLQDVTPYKQQELERLAVQQKLEAELLVCNSSIQEIYESLLNTISERSQILQKLRKSRQFIDRFIASSPCLLYIYDLDRHIHLYTNQESLQKLGYTPAQIAAPDFDIVKQLLYPSDRAAVAEHLAKCRHLRQGKTLELDYRMYHADRSLRWFRSYDTPFEIDPDGLVHQIAGVAIDITAQKQAELALAESEQRNRAILGAIPDLILRLRRDGTCLECLPPAPPHRFSLVQQHISEILPPPLQQKLLQVIATALDQQSLQVYEQEIYKFGRLCLEEVYVVAVGAEEVLVLVRDISDRQELAQQKEITQLQRRFFAMLSHEFRTPLSTILGSVELLQHSHAEWLDDKAKRNLNRIAVCVQDALELLENMLTLSRVDAGSLQIKPQYINLRRFTEELVDSITTARQIVMEAKTSGEDFMGYVDPFILRRILVNLLSNAIKYSTPDTEIRVVLLINLTQDQAIWQVIDRGIGICTTELEQIFSPWQRGTNTDTTRGSGLGLSVVQGCIHAIGGVIAVLSQENVGTTFTVIVPISSSEQT